MRQTHSGWKVPNFPIAMDWFEALPGDSEPVLNSKDRLEAPFILAPQDGGTGQFARFHLRHSNRANGGREAAPERQKRLELLHGKYQAVHRGSNMIVTLPPEVQWAFGLTTREHLLLILLWIRRSEDALTGKRVLKGAGYFATSLMLRLCGRRDGKWRDTIAGLAKKGIINDWNWTPNPKDPRFRLCDWSFPDDVLRVLASKFVPTWAYEPVDESCAKTPSVADKDLRQDTDTCARTPAPGHGNSCARTRGSASGHGEPAPGQHRLTDRDDLSDLVDPSGPPLTAGPGRGGPAAQASRHCSDDKTSQESSNIPPQDPSPADLMDDTYLVPLDFGTASSTRSGTSSSSVVLKELTEVIHERCSRSADDYVVELTDGTMRERPRVPQQRWISKEVSRRAPSVVTVLEDDEIRGVVLDYMQSRETRFKVTAIIDDLEELTADAGSQVEARRDALEQEAQQLAGIPMIVVMVPMRTRTMMTRNLGGWGSCTIQCPARTSSMMAQ